MKRFHRIAVQSLIVAGLTWPEPVMMFTQNLGMPDTTLASSARNKKPSFRTV